MTTSLVPTMKTDTRILLALLTSFLGWASLTVPLILVFDMGSLGQDLVFWASVITMAVITATQVLPYFFSVDQSPWLMQPLLIAPLGGGISAFIFALVGALLYPSPGGMVSGMVGGAYGFVTGLIAAVISWIYFALRGLK